MKKIILLTIITLMMIGCAEESAQPKELHGTRTYIVDSCEYVGFGVGYPEGWLSGGYSRSQRQL